jgi:hypothetical protein
MAIDVERIYNLLPSIYRIRDEEQGTPLRQLLAVIAEQVAVLQEALAQLYDDQFVETATDWVIPYIGDLIGYRALNGMVPQIASPRAEVANTIGYRRRKGTASVLEELARAVTGWEAHVVEFFQLLAITQYMNHIRLQNRVSPHLGKGIAFAPPALPPNWERLERLNSAFDTVAHTLDVRHISSGRGKYNIPNVGIYLWRLRAYSLTDSPATKLDDHRYLFSPLGNNTQLFNRPVTQTTISELATPHNVPEPLSRRVLDAYLKDQYGRSLALKKNGADVSVNDIVICNLSDAGSGEWAHEPPQGKIAVDPVLGRIACNSADVASESLLVTYNYGFSDDLGGGEYNRLQTFSPVQMFPPGPSQPVGAGESIQTALNAVMANGGVVEIQDSARYAESLSINAGANAVIELRAANETRPHLGLQNDFQIDGADTSEVVLNGLLINGRTLRVVGNLSKLILRHCTLVPGLTLDINGAPQAPTTPSLVIETANASVEIDHCIIGGIRADPEANVILTDSIVDATDAAGIAFAATDDESAGGELTIENSTLIGKVHTRLMQLASNAIFLASLSSTDTWIAPVLCERRQEGCIRFSYVPLGSRTPRRYKCQPAWDGDATRVRPQFTSLRYGDAGYCQLSQRCAVEIRTGADDEAEMGAFHKLYQPQRETNLRVRLDEYLRFGLEAGIFYAT